MFENIGAIDTAATNLNSAISGGYSMDYEGALQLQKFVKGMQTAVEEILFKSNELSQTPELGSTPAANVYKPYLPTVATDPEQGFVPVISKVKDQLDQAANNIQGSITAYEQSDQSAADGLLNIHAIET
ncbi:MAG TPA: hypothetical protein VHX38_41740 [Pseudonocardiaceae bacterium]|jgi:hypothetical protein|nr:hypothetical protein [Pseudonocardiaceae bacterium]